MPIGAVITLILTLTAIFGFLVYFITQRGKLQLPNGEHWNGERKGFKTTLVKPAAAKIPYDKATSSYNEKDLVGRCCDINLIVQTAFRDRSLVSSAVIEKCKEIVLYVMDNETYDKSGGKKWEGYYSNTEAYISQCRKKFSSNYAPMICVRDRHVDRIALTGEPLVHELCHAYLDDYEADSTDHADPRVWFSVGGSSSVQGLVRGKLRC
jgi:hypothetical protein